MTHPDRDPEVLADLRFRDASERDPDRSSRVTCECTHRADAHDSTTGRCNECGCQEYERAAALTWSPPVIVERWPCTGCNALVDMPRDAIEVHERFSRQLQRRGQPPLVRRIPCERCKRREEAQEQSRPHEQRRIAGLDNERQGESPARKGRP